MHYVAFIHAHQLGANERGYGISFPDLPGCISAGDTVDEALIAGGQALGLYVEGLMENDSHVPLPRTMQDIIDDPDLSAWRTDAQLVLVPVVINTGTSRRVRISLDDGLLRHIDAEAHHRNMTRSAFLAGAAWNEIHYPRAIRAARHE